MKKLMVLFCMLILGAMVQPASAKPSAHVGFSVDPDNFLVGARWMKPLSSEGLFMAPSIEAGFGDVTMVAGNFDVHYRFQGNAKFYVGAGATLNWFDWDGGSDTEFGGSVLGGIMLNTKSGKLPFFEAKFGLGDTPDWKFMLGLNF